MKLLIIEDEVHSALMLKNMLLDINSNFEIIDVIDSVVESVSLLISEPEIDLIFMDIKLSDGLSFEIFKQVDLNIPVIFTTSFNDYAIQAFKVNSVDYLLKPFDKDELERSISKYNYFFKSNLYKMQIDNVIKQLSRSNPEYRSRLLVKTAQGLISISISDISYFYIESNVVFAKMYEGKKYSIDKSIEELEKTINPKLFFRVNRQVLVSVNSIQSIHNYFNNTLKVYLSPPIDRDIIVSRYNVKKFKMWLDS